MEFEKITLTRANINNLKKLADYLESLPYRYKHFDMLDFLDAQSNEAAVVYAKENGGVHTCGTVACAVGHGPSAGILFRNSDFTEEYDWNQSAFVMAPDWSSYAQRFTGIDDPLSRKFEWLFGSDWVEVDNHHYGAAARIRYLLEYRQVPSGFLSGYAERKHRSLYQEFRKPSRSKA